MIRGVHTMLYTPKADEARAFIRDVLGFKDCFDAGGGWLIFKLPESEMGCHPVEEGSTKPKHEISFYCDDIEQTVSNLKSKGVEFTRDVVDQGYGYETAFLIPGGVEISLYQPKYPKP